MADNACSEAKIQVDGGLTELSKKLWGLVLNGYEEESFLGLKELCIKLQDLHVLHEDEEEMDWADGVTCSQEDEDSVEMDWVSSSNFWTWRQKEVDDDDD